MQGIRLNNLEKEVRSKMESDRTGHDWWHIVRVKNTALKLAKKEEANQELVHTSALVHDITDHKFFKGSQIEAHSILTELLTKNGASERFANEVLKIVDGISYKGAGVKTSMHTLEGKVVQDSDRLDALGAVGIARCFAYGGAKGRMIYDPEMEPTMHQNFEEYKTSEGASIQHFYEKLLLLKDRMQTKSGKEIAIQRHQFLELYLEQFFREWIGEG